MSVEVKFALGKETEGVAIGLVEARGVDFRPSPPGKFSALAESFARGGGAAVSPDRKAAVRAMLRYGIYKPAGRAKPSSEYLAQAALEGDFPAVNHMVDATNIVSLQTGYPISLVDLGKTGFELLLRRGRDGEGYVFNPGGQEIDCRDLLCLCRKIEDGDIHGFVPTANPVRDSMATKVFQGVETVLAVIYAPEGPEGRDLEKACADLAGYLSEIACAVEWEIAEP
ncbi:MAG: B3/4 domain-containing protein [Spirochaetes bacterium]|nr:MAG: B3/4 domain-containing protein [Spirochaetota bacterium]